MPSGAFRLPVRSMRGRDLQPILAGSSATGVMDSKASSGISSCSASSVPILAGGCSGAGARPSANIGSSSDCRWPEPAVSCAGAGSSPGVSRSQPILAGESSSVANIGWSPRASGSMSVPAWLSAGTPGGPAWLPILAGDPSPSANIGSSSKAESSSPAGARPAGGAAASMCTSRDGGARKGGRSEFTGRPGRPLKGRRHGHPSHPAWRIWH